MKALKKAAYNHILTLLDEKISVAKKAVISARESRDNETKSSAGDKYETGRAMSQMELENSEIHLANVLTLKRQLDQIDFQKKSKTIVAGCMVKTDNEVYLISIGLGKIQVNDQACYAISLQSPIGQVMQGKKAGDVLSFQNEEFVVREIF